MSQNNNSISSLGQNQQTMNEGLRSIKGDTSVIREDTQKIRKDTRYIKAQNTVIARGVSQVGRNQNISYVAGKYSQKNILKGVIGVGATVTAVGVATTDAIKNLTTVVIVVGILLMLGLGALAWLFIEKFKELEKRKIQNE